MRGTVLHLDGGPAMSPTGALIREGVAGLGSSMALKRVRGEPGDAAVAL